MSNDKYCYGCQEKLPCQCKTTWFDSDGKVIDSHENKLRKQIKSLEAKLALAVTGLEFYADEKNQIAPIYYPTGKPGADFTQPYRMDKGRLARQIIAQIKEQK